MRSIGRASLVFLLGLMVASGAWADRGHGGGHGGYLGGHGYGHGHGHGYYRGGVGVGVLIDPFWGPWYYPSPYYYPPVYPPVIQVPVAPPVYVEQESAPEVVSPPSSYWYYCSGSRNYYPYVKECPGGWQRVAPVPPEPSP